MIFGSLPVLGSVPFLLGLISGLYRTPSGLGPHRKETGPGGSRQQATGNQPQVRPGPDPKRQPSAGDWNTHPENTAPKVYFRGPIVELLPHLDQMYSFRSTLRECYALGSWSHDRQVLSLFGATCVRIETLRLYTWHSGATGLSCRDSGLQLFSPQSVSDRVSGLVQTPVLLTLHVLQR